MTGRFKVIIVNYASLRDTVCCIRSLRNQEICALSDIIVVDNHSPDGSGQELARMFSEVNVVLLARNGGFGTGINQGINTARAELYLVLNPDTRFTENQLFEAVRQFEEDPRLGILGLNLIYPDGTPQYSARTHYSWGMVVLRRTPLGKLPIFSRMVDAHLMKGAWSRGIFDADWVFGTGFMIRGSAFTQIGGMDEGFFMYMEDVDLCARMAIAGWKVRAIPYVRLIHDHKRASGGSVFSTASKAHLIGLFRFIRKYGMPWFSRPNLSSMKKRLRKFEVTDK
jgi:N-acetylglucosaminyl-diphospho-decaprenol L-rhamnosyltransferase